MKQLEEFRIKPTINGIYGVMVMTIMPIAFFIWIYPFNIYIAFIIFRIFIYPQIDFVFTRKFKFKRNRPVISFLLLQIPLNVTCYTVIKKEPILNPFSTSAKSQGYDLVLIRNEKQFWKRLFKNRIELYPEDRRLDLVGIAKKIEGMFGIPYRGIDLGVSNGGYTDDQSVLRKNKGIIP